MYTANVTVRVNTFRKTTGEFGPGRSPTPPYIDAELFDLTDTSPGRPPGVSKVFTLDPDGTIHIKVPTDYRNGAQITYQLPCDETHNLVIIGIAFAVSDEVGRDEFPMINILRDPTSSMMTVTNLCEPRLYRVNFTYGIVIQQVQSGDIGIYDPGIIVDPIEHAG